MFTPAPAVLGIFQGGWVTILVLLAILSIAYFFVKRGAIRLLIALMAAAVIYTGFTWSAWTIFTWIFWILWVVIAFVALHDLWRGTSDRTWSRTRRGGWLTVLFAMILAANLPSAGLYNPFSQFGAMRAEIAKMDKAATERVNALALAETKKDSEQDARLTKLEKQVADHEKRLDKLEKQVTGIQSVAVPANVDRSNYYDQMTQALVGAGWKPGDFTIGTVDWSRNGYDAGTRSFVKSRIDSQAGVRTFLNGSSAESKAARAHILSVLPAYEHTRALSGQGFVPMQFNTDVCLDGNTYFFDARAMRDGQRCHSAGDIVWIYIAENGTVYWDASVRADCGNPGMTAVPYPKGTTTRVSVTPRPKTGTTSRPTQATTPKPTATKSPTPSRTTRPSSTPTPTPSTSTPTCREKECESPISPTRQVPTSSPTGPRENAEPVESNPATTATPDVPAPGAATSPPANTTAPTAPSAPPSSSGATQSILPPSE